MVKLTIALTPQQEEWLKAEARRLGISPAELLRRWIDQKRGEA